MSEEDLTNYKITYSDLDITKYIVLDNESNYWYSAEYVDKMLKKQDKEIKRLNNILDELEEDTRCGYYEYNHTDGDYIEGYDDGASKTADFFNKMIKELRGDSK